MSNMNNRSGSASAFAVVLAVLVATSSSSSGVHGASISRRQFPSDAPSCATLCISAKIREAADPGLATSCNGITGAAYVTCLCSTSTFTRAYDTCLSQNCIFPAEVATAKSLFSSFCNSPTADQIEAAEAVAQRADVSRSSYYATASTSSTSGVSTSTSGVALSTSGASSSAPSSASSAISTTTLPSTTGSSSTGSQSSASITTTGTSGTSGTTGTAGTVTTLPTSGAPENTDNASLQPGSSGATLGAAGIASARANATGVNAASSIDTRLSAVLATVCGLAIGLYLV